MSDAAPHVFELAGLKVHATREGDHVTGRADFPHESCGRTSVPINYRNAPTISTAIQAAPGERSSAPLDSKTRERLEAVRRFNQLLISDPRKQGRSRLARLVADEYGCSVRSLQLWLTRYEAEGPAGLADRYVNTPGNILSISSERARDAVTAAAWWAFRIGNLPSIDSAAVAAFACPFTRKDPAPLDRSPLADVIATIECYYSWPCDRSTKYRFKPLAKWVRYDYERWLIRACEQHDTRRAVAANIPDARTRRKDAGHHQTRRAIANIATSAAKRFGHTGPVEVHINTRTSDGTPRDRASKLRRAGFDQAARTVLATVPVEGPPQLAATAEPATIAEALGALDGAFRRVIIDASKGDRTAFDEALATLPFWWMVMPATVRNNIDAQVEAWRKDHPRVTDMAVQRRKLNMLLPTVRGKDAGWSGLNLAGRIA